MRKTLISIATLLVLSGVAAAGGSKGTVGVGVDYNLFGTGGASVVYDGGMFHAGAGVGFSSIPIPADAPTKTTTFDVNGEFFYHAHSTAMSDFGVGGQFGFQSINPPGANNSSTNVYIDLGAQIRVFVVSNVALSATLGLGIATADADGVILTGQPVGALGLHYYFF